MVRLITGFLVSVLLATLVPGLGTAQPIALDLYPISPPQTSECGITGRGELIAISPFTNHVEFQRYSPAGELLQAGQVSADFVEASPRGVARSRDGALLQWSEVLIDTGDDVEERTMLARVHPDAPSSLIYEITTLGDYAFPPRVMAMQLDGLGWISATINVLKRITPDLQVQPFQVLDFPSPSNILQLSPLPDGGWMMAIDPTYGDPDAHVASAKVDASGTVVGVSDATAVGSMEVVAAAVGTTRHAIVITSYSTSALLLYDLAGSSITTLSLPDCWITDMTALRNGDFLLVGRYTPNLQPLLIRVDDNGQVLWTDINLPPGLGSLIRDVELAGQETVWLRGQNAVALVDLMPTASPVRVLLFPNTLSATVPAEGGAVTLGSLLLNIGQDPFSGQARAALAGPWVGLTPVLTLPVTLGPGAVEYQAGRSLSIPGGAPPGSYRLHAGLCAPGGPWLDQQFIAFRKVAD